MTKKKIGDGRWNRRNVKVGLSAAMLIVAGILGYRHLAGADDSAGPEVMASLQDKTWKVECTACGEAYTMPAAEYMALVEDRSAEAAGIVCDRCGASAAWRADRPIEYTDEQWKAGWVGRDVLISDLKAWHKAHPEAESVAANPDGEDE